MSRNCQGGCDITLLGVTAHVCSCNSLPTQTKKLQTAVQPRLRWGQTEVQTLHSLPLKWWIERLQKENACVGIFPTCHIKANFIISAKQHIICEFEILNCSPCYLQMNLGGLWRSRSKCLAKPWFSWFQASHGRGAADIHFLPTGPCISLAVARLCGWKE